MEKKALRLTGAWTREGQYGSFSVGTVKLAELNEALAALGNPDVFELVISPAEKKSDISPDFHINLRPKRAKMEGDVVGKAQAPRTAGGEREVAGKAQAPRTAGGEREVANTRRF